MDSKRVANQAVLRSVNERISFLNEEFSARLDLDPVFICECPDLGCIEPVSVSAADYRRIRNNRTWFFVVADHVDYELEAVVEKHQAFTVVSVPEHLLPDQADDI